jgi:hypothetical protein
MNDPTNPNHYRSHPSGIECIEITRHMSFDLGNAVKYIWRADLKHQDGGLEDLRKAAWYIADEIKRREAANTQPSTSTPDAETSPAEPPSRPAQDGLRVGARVRVLPTSPFMPGAQGRIIDQPTCPPYEWSVQLDGRWAPSEMRSSELEVIA